MPPARTLRAAASGARPPRAVRRPTGDRGNASAEASHLSCIVYLCGALRLRGSDLPPGAAFIGIARRIEQLEVERHPRVGRQRGGQPACGAR